MSVDIDWAALTGGPEGDRLAESVRDFLHERFQNVTLPKFIRSVKVHSFDCGSVAPELELKDICDPLPDFYEDDEDSEDEEHDSSSPQPVSQTTAFEEHGTDSNHHIEGLENIRAASQASQSAQSQTNSLSWASGPSNGETGFPAPSNRYPPLESPNPFLSRSSTPGVPGGTSNMSYFHMPLSGGLSGAATPFAGSHFGGNNLVDYLNQSHINTTAREARSADAKFSGSNSLPGFATMPTISEPQRDVGVNDVQIVARVKYSGNVKLSLTAEILLDYPMTSFVGIPLQLNITGMTFDGVAILAYIRKRAHFCFLSPEDADALVGRDSESEGGGENTRKEGDGRVAIGGLFEDIKVESEIGQRAGGKQVLKNVGKVEKFVLEQVRKIFESEFVYPSFWTFLV